MKFLLVLHEDSLSGAPIAALNWAEVLKSYRDTEIDVVVLNSSGDLNVRFNELGLTRIQRSALTLVFPEYMRLVRIRQILFYLKYGTPARNARHINRSYDVVLFNSVVTLKACLQILPLIRIKKVLWLHEMGNAIFNFLGNDYPKIAEMDLVFSPSEAGRVNLIQNNIPAEKIHLLPLVLSSSQRYTPDQKDEPFTVGNLANVGWPKGFDYFLAVAKNYSELYPEDNVQFLWKGFSAGSFEYSLATCEIRQAQLEKVVQLQYKDADNCAFFRKLHVLLLTSKEDTYPFVMLEAASAGIPTIAFTGSGGATEFISDYGGICAPYLSVSAYTDAIKTYYDQRNLLKEHGLSARRLVERAHIGNKNLAQKILSVFQDSQLIS